MNNLHQDNEKNEFEDELSQLKEWQDNQHNPGYYIGSGRIPRPIHVLGRHPWLLVILGIVSLIPVLLEIINFISETENIFTNILSLVIPLIIAGSFIYGGITRITRKRKM